MKKLISLFLVCVIVISVFITVPINTFASVEDIEQSANTSDDFVYIVLSDGTAEITGYTGSETMLVIPSELDGYKVTSIAEYAFGWCENLVSVTLPKDVTSIGKGAFYECTSLAEVTIPDNVTSIGDMAFSDCYRLKSIVIPNGVTMIGDSAFSSCLDLSEVTIPDSVTSIGNKAFLVVINLHQSLYQRVLQR